MRLYGVRVWVNDMAAARAFYGGTLGLAALWDWGGDAAVGYDVGATLLVEHDDGSHPDEALVGRFVGVSLSVSDIEATYRELTAKGVAFTGPPEKMPWGGTLANFKDPSGNVLTLLGEGR
jgi:catechol 2,3-dioxygenase-like lactoylglutathione lyase family enzyme